MSKFILLTLSLLVVCTSGWSKRELPERGIYKLTKKSDTDSFYNTYFTVSQKNKIEGTLYYNPEIIKTKLDFIGNDHLVKSLLAKIDIDQVIYCEGAGYYNEYTENSSYASGSKSKYSIYFIGEISACIDTEGNIILVGQKQSPENLMKIVNEIKDSIK